MKIQTHIDTAHPGAVWTQTAPAPKRRQRKGSFNADAMHLLAQAERIRRAALDRDRAQLTAQAGDTGLAGSGTTTTASQSSSRTESSQSATPQEGAVDWIDPSTGFAGVKSEPVVPDAASTAAAPPKRLFRRFPSSFEAMQSSILDSVLTRHLYSVQVPLPSRAAAAAQSKAAARARQRKAPAPSTDETASVPATTPRARARADKGSSAAASSVTPRRAPSKGKPRVAASAAAGSAKSQQSSRKRKAAAVDKPRRQPKSSAAASGATPRTGGTARAAKGAHREGKDASRRANVPDWIDELEDNFFETSASQSTDKSSEDRSSSPDRTVSPTDTDSTVTDGGHTGDVARSGRSDAADGGDQATSSDPLMSSSHVHGHDALSSGDSEDEMLNSDLPSCSGFVPQHPTDDRNESMHFPYMQDSMHLPDDEEWLPGSSSPLLTSSSARYSGVDAAAAGSSASLLSPFKLSGQQHSLDENAVPSTTDTTSLLGPSQRGTVQSSWDDFDAVDASSPFSSPARGPQNAGHADDRSDALSAAGGPTGGLVKATPLQDVSLKSLHSPAADKRRRALDDVTQASSPTGKRARLDPSSQHL